MTKAINYCLCIAVSLLVLAFLLPGHYLPLGTFHQDALSWLALLIAFAGVCVVGTKQIKFSAAVPIVLVIALLPLLQYVTGIVFYFGDALLASLYLAGFALAIVVGFNWRHQSLKNPIIGPVHAVFGCLLFSAIVSSGIAAYQWLGLTQAGIWIVDVPPGSGGNGNLAQRNNLGSLLWMGLVATFYFWQRGLFSRYSVAIIGGFLVLGLALSQSRTPWITAGVAVFWIYSQRHIIGKWREQLCWLIGFSVFYLLLTLIFLPALADGLLLSHQEYLRSAEVGARQVMWESMIAAITSGPWWGFGWNQISVAQFLVVHDYPGSTWTEHSHNLFIDLLVWNGPLLGGLIIMLILCWAYRQVRSVGTQRHFYSLWAIGCLAVHSMLEYPIEYAFFLVPLGLLVGMVDYDSQMKHRVIKLPSIIGVGAVPTFLLLFYVIIDDYRLIAPQYQKLRFEAARFVDADKILVPAGTVRGLTHIDNLMKFSSILAVESMSAQELDRMRKITARYPYPSNLYQYALALGLNNHVAEAQRILKVINELWGEGRYVEAIEGLSVEAEEHKQLSAIILGLAPTN